MTTTSLFAEIVVIGAGAVLAALLWGWVLLGGGPVPSLGDDLAPIVVCLLPFVYFFGLLTDRVADRCFGPVERVFGPRVYGAANLEAFRNAYFVDHRLVREESGPLTAVLDYARSRIRICRGWFVNMVLLGAAAGVAMARGQLGSPLEGGLVIGAAVALCLGCVWIVVTDTREYVAKVRRQAAWLRARP